MIISYEPNQRCPECHFIPRGWWERPAHGSRELYWIGCKKCGHIAGGLCENVAIQNWLRLVATIKFNLEVKKISRTKGI